MKRFFIAMVFLFATVCLAVGAHAQGPIRIDGSSDSAANESFKRMLAQLPTDRQRKLLSALVQLYVSGVHSAYEVVDNPKFQNMSAAGVKDKIAGMTADEIVEYAKQSHKPGDPKTE